MNAAPASPAAAPDLSVVIPIYNERDNIRALHSALTHSLRRCGRTYEILLVDDGSDDGGREVLRELAGVDPHLRIVLLSRNYGQTTAMAAGFDRARGSVIITMDGDLQNDPADIPRLLERLEEGYDIVCGWRRNRQDRVSTRLLPSRLANMMIRSVTGVRIHDTGCSLKAYRAWVVRSLTLYSDMHRFMAALGAGVGARVTELPVRHHARRFGQSKYGLGRIFRVLADVVVVKMLIQFAAHPIRYFGLLALVPFLLAPFLFALGTFDMSGQAAGVDMPLQAAGGVALLVAANLFLLGFLAELQMKASAFFKRRSAITAREAAH